jgi:hypothetical protein
MLAQGRNQWSEIRTKVARANLRPLISVPWNAQKLGMPSKHLDGKLRSSVKEADLTKRDHTISEARISSCMARSPFARTSVPASARADVKDRYARVYRLATSLRRSHVS